MASNKSAANQPWWKEAVVYQIYPASFKDSNGDGIGDLPGITSKLDYIKSLGANVIWICPMYDSPQYDLGYDIADYEAIHKPYGTMEDMQALIDGCHQRGMRILVDLVVNHSSHLHKWFQESRSSKTNPKRDWYIWRPPKYDAQGNQTPPNNWRSAFGGSTWTWDETTQEYYLHLFAPEQPDLNWENPETRQAIYQSAVKFWLGRGVDGFRVDTVNLYSKPQDFPDAAVTNPHTPWQKASGLYCNGPRMAEFLAELKGVMADYDTMTVGELPHTPPDVVARYVGGGARLLDMVFQFDVVDLGVGRDVRYDTVPFNWRLPQLKRAIGGMQALIGREADGWATVFMENHDVARSVSRFASDRPEHRVRSGRMLALLNATLSGTLFVYQGQEIGMVNLPAEWPLEEYKDIESCNYVKEVEERSGNDPKALESARMILQHLSRDNARVPMTWDGSPQGGFSESPDTWMRTHGLYREINVARQEGDDASVLGFWKKALKLRKARADLLVYGQFELLDAENEKTFMYLKRNGDGVALVVLNFTVEPQVFAVPEALRGGLRMETSTYGDDGQDPGVLRAYEGRLYL